MILIMIIIRILIIIIIIIILTIIIIILIMILYNHDNNHNHHHGHRHHHHFEMSTLWIFKKVGMSSWGCWTFATAVLSVLWQTMHITKPEMHIHNTQWKSTFWCDFSHMTWSNIPSYILTWDFTLGWFGEIAMIWYYDINHRYLYNILCWATWLMWWSISISV